MSKLQTVTGEASRTASIWRQRFSLLVQSSSLLNNDTSMSRTLTRSRFMGIAAGAGLLVAGNGAAQTGGRMHQRKIPSSGEMLPVVGVGTWRTFDVGAKPEDRAPLAEVLRLLFAAGGSVTDTSPSRPESDA